MAANTLGRNITFQIYNSDDTPFEGLILHKSVVDSVVMSLGDNITGDVYYKNNALNVTMNEYIEYKGVKYVLVNPPTILREGMVKDNGELKGMTKYSFTFYHPMYQLGNMPFCDVAISSDQQRYLSENKVFSWIGYPNDYIAKLNKNLDGTEWIVEKSNRFPALKDNVLSEVLSFENNTIADALKTFYDTWEVPYVVDVVSSGESSYAQGKRFKVVVGLPSNEIYASESDKQLMQPYVFKMGQGVGLKNNSRTPRNNKIITRISGYGSEDNIPYGYPQIVWDGAEDDPRLRYPLYDGIVGGRYVKLIKHPFTRTYLMPSIYSETVNKKVNPNAVGYDHTIELKDYYDAIRTEEYPYVNEINPLAPSYESHQFDVKPEMDDGQSNVEILDAIPLNADLTPAESWDDTMDGDGNYLQSYFQITLPVLSFDLYACAAITQEMSINMRGGACIGCTFPIQVNWDDYKANFYDQDGNFAPDGEQRDLTKYPKSNLESISVVVQKEYQTFGTIMPNVFQQPRNGDEFVVLGISLPSEYISNAEERLDREMKSYMLENNIYYFDYPLKFDEYFLATHTYILEQLKPNSVVRFDFAGNELQLFVKQLTIKYGENVLPQYDITLTDNVEVVLNQIGQVAEDVERLSSVISILRESYGRNVWTELSKKLSKVNDDTAQGFIRFIKGLQVGERFVSGLLGEGAVFRKEADGTTYLEADKMYIRMKAYFDTVEIRKYLHSAGNRVASDAGAKCIRVEYIDADGNVTSDAANAVVFRCYFRGSDGDDEVTNDFLVGDQVYCHITNGSTQSLQMHHYWRLLVGRNAEGELTEDGEHWIDLSNRPTETVTIDGSTYTHAGYQAGSDIPVAQDDMVQLGNISDKTRQGAIIEYVSGADSPSYQIYQGINDFSLDGKNQLALGYNTQTGRAYLNVYGDAYIGDRNGASYIRYNTATKKMEIKAEVNIQSTFDGKTLPDYIAEHSSEWTEEEITALFTDDFNNIDAEIKNIQKQVDGSIETWFYNGVPSSSVLPESEWKAKDIAAGNNNERLKHLGDLYYDNQSGYAYRYTNQGTESVPQFVWTQISDSAVIKALENAAKAQDTADHKRRVFVRQPLDSEDYDVGDLWVNATYPSGNTQTDDANGRYYNDILKCIKHKDKNVAFSISDWGLSSKYTDDSKFDGYINQILNGTTETTNSAIVANALNAITTAIIKAPPTAINGGLVLTSLLGMRDANSNTWAGISGLYESSETGTGYKGHGIAAWYGGGMADWEVYKETYPSATITDNYAKSLFRFDGSGYLAGGNITWDKNGIVTIANVYANIGGTDTSLTGTLQTLTNLSNALPLSLQSGVTYLDPKYSFTNLSVLGKSVATQEYVSQNYLSINFFKRLFQAHNGSENVNPNDTSTTITDIEAMFGFWTNQYISTLGKGGSGSSSVFDEDAMWQALGTNRTSKLIASAYLGNVTKTLTIKDGNGTTLGTYNGTTAQTITVSASGNYLPLTGGIMTGDIVSTAEGLIVRMNTDSSNAKNGLAWYNADGSTQLGGIMFHNTAKRVMINATGVESMWNDQVGNYTFIVGENEIKYNTYNVLHTGNYTTLLSGSVTNAMLAGSIANNKLVNSSVTINGSNVSLGGSVTTTKWGTARNITIKDATSTNAGTPASIDGSAAVTLLLPSTIKASLTGNADTATTASKLSTTSKTAWGRTYWTSGGIPTDISGNMAGVGDITSSSSYSLRDSSSNPYLNLRVGSQDWYVQSISDGIYIGSTSSLSLKVDASGNVTVVGTLGVTGATTLSSTLGVTGLLTANGGINIPSGKTLTIGDAVISWDNDKQGLKITKGLYSETFISALGKGSSGSSSVFDEAAMWTALGGSIDNKQIALSHLTTALSSYATQTWVTQQIAASATTGTVTAVKVGTTTYNPSSGVVSLPAYPTKASQLTNDSGFITSSALTSYIQHIEVGTDDLTGRSGSFFFGGDNALQSDCDYVGFQAGNSNDKWQMVAIDTLKWRQNDSGGTSTSWGQWYNITDNIYIQKELSSAGWYRVADVSNYGGSIILSICQNFNYSAPNPATFIISHSYSTTSVSYYDSIVQLGGSGFYNGSVKNVRLMRYDYGKVYIEIYYVVNVANTVGVELTPIGRRLHGYITPIDFTSVTSTSGLTLADSCPVMPGGVSGVGYTGSGGQQNPDFFGGNKVGFLMSNQTVNGDSTYKNWMYMDCYHSTDAGGTTALGISRSNGKVFAMRSDANRTSWNTLREVITTDDGTANVSLTGNVTITKYDGGFRISSPQANEIFMFGASTSGYIWGSVNGNYLRFLNGNVGIGTVSPSYKLDVNGDVRATNFRGSLVGNADTATTASKLSTTSKTAWGRTYWTSGGIPTNISGTLSSVLNIEFTGVSSSAGHGGYLDFHYNGNSADYTSRIIEDAEGRLEINSQLFVIYGGNVGIGTPSPSYKLHVNGTFYASGNSSIGGTFGVSGATTLSNTLSVTGDTTLSGNLSIANSKRIYFKNTSGGGVSALLMDTSNNFVIGEGMSSYNTYLRGSSLTFQTGSSHTERMTIDANGRVYVVNGSQGLRIGDALLTWDSTNNAIKVSAVNGSGQVNFYATGGVSALGVGGSGSSSGGIDADWLKNNDVQIKRLGIGVAPSSSYQLNVQGASNFTGAVTINNNLSVNSGISSIGGISTSQGSISAAHDITAGGNGLVYNRLTVGKTSVDTSYIFFVNGSACVSNGLYLASDVYIKYSAPASGVKLCNITAPSGLTVNGSTSWSSDMRKKDVVSYVNDLDVNKVAKAPVFRFTWKDKRDSVVRVGTSAQYWQSALDSSVMDMGEYGLMLDYNAIAIASAVITARKVVDHELHIKQLEERVRELEDEIKELKAA